MRHINKEVNELISSIKTDQEELLQYIESWKQQNTPEVDEELSSITNQLIEIVKLDDLVELLRSLQSETHRSSEIGLIMFIGTLPDQIKFLDTKVEMRSTANKIGQNAKKSWKRLKTIVLQFLKGISNYIWALLAKFTNPKGWSVTGGINAGFPGLSGTIQLQIHF